jgi:hypothetical protein
LSVCFSISLRSPGDSAVETVARLLACEPGVRILAGIKECLLKNVHIGSGTHTDTVVLLGKEGLGRHPGCEVAYSLPYSAELKNVWSCTFSVPRCQNGVDRDFIFTFSY